ncbi:hypothetical protein NQ317_006280 [Molorchus minor]|uniref:Nuclear pore complex protein NUP96 C-terminal domain-containing protein n=1 Tax=Molorchus minor TaxID=1323400 RepID=A0ABQ9J503_9CUCU|nr:hypothetical protein NQ317_006280 [Molorchus minor]
MEIPTGVIQNRCCMDLSVFKGKSFRAGWTKGFDFFSLNTKHGEINGELALNTIQMGSYSMDFDPMQKIIDTTYGSGQFSSSAETMGKFTINWGRQMTVKEILLSFNCSEYSFSRAFKRTCNLSPNTVDILAESLEIVLEESTYDLDHNSIPTFKIVKDLSYLKKQTKLFMKLVARHNDKESRYLHSIWTLAAALWGPGEDTFTNRRLKINTTYDDVSKDPVKNIFNQLTVFKILEAADLAMDNRFPNLALLVSQLSLTNRTKLFLQEQIEVWYKSMIANHIGHDVKKIYMLLSGTSTRENVNIFEDVDWKRAFGMHLWYICAAGTPVEAAIELYKKAFEEKGYAEPPYPPYKSDYSEEGPFDVLYHILLLYKTRIHSLSSVLNPATHTDNLLDYRLSWLLLQLFLSLDVGLIETSEKTKFCTSLSNQLESIGKWEWAIFVLLYLEDNVSKKNLIMQILDRNLGSDADKTTTDLQDELVNKMHIPPEWIHTVKGEKLLLLEKYFPAFNHLAFAREYYRANDILMEHLIPNLFINEQYDVIKVLIDNIKDGSSTILHWNNQAGLFSDFLELQEDVISAKVEDLLKLQMKLQSISDRISTFNIKTDQQKLCIAEMSKRCASVYKELCKKSESSLFKNSYSDFIETLVMPPDFKQNEALYIINQFVLNILSASSEPGNTTQRRVQAHLELAKWRFSFVMRKSDTQLAFRCLGIGIVKDPVTGCLSLTICCVNCIPLTDAALLQIRLIATHYIYGDQKMTEEKKTNIGAYQEGIFLRLRCFKRLTVVLFEQISHDVMHALTVIIRSREAARKIERVNSAAVEIGKSQLGLAACQRNHSASGYMQAPSPVPEGDFVKVQIRRRGI